MELGLILNTCGITTRDDNDWWHQPTDADQIRPVESAQLAERLGFHSVFVGDHVSLKETSPESVSPVHVDGRSNEEVRQRGVSDEDVGAAGVIYRRARTFSTASPASARSRPVRAASSSAPACSSRPTVTR